LARRASRDLPRFVICGDLEDDVYLSAGAAIRERIHALDLGTAVLLTGFVPDETLAALYSGALAVCLPSLAEGFGLPAVDAAGCGAPVVLSDIPAHRETMGDATLFFPPRNPNVLSDMLQQVAGSDMLRRSLSERGQRRVARFSWDASAEALRD